MSKSSTGSVQGISLRNDILAGVVIDRGPHGTESFLHGCVQNSTLSILCTRSHGGPEFSIVLVQ